MPDLHNKSCNDSRKTLESVAYGTDSKEDTCERIKSNSFGSLFKNWPLMSSVLVYCIFSLQDMAYTEIFALWAVSPRKLGGSSYSTDDVGEILAMTELALSWWRVLQECCPSLFWQVIPL